ncbi:phage exclusion protein Lit family protein [Aeromonas molluscorum]|uniref:Phage exclusion protein Lit n=1 Tax=Aeromonas molluscorum 848 TaxID=1268236 RepID=R1F0D8_9GAMM|nr:phage exclusion protein Lit family protein [Aeromonas molluscorum]EOD53453.1 phage exclusion protein Lit [Aeromonas molluscorum 848]
MKVNHYNRSHKGYLPIRVLQHNIIAQFENTTSNFLNDTLETVRSKGLKTEITYTINISSQKGEKVKGPFVYSSSKEINIHETFLAYLWCVTFSLYIYTDLILSGKLEDDNEKKKWADKTFDYALSLIDGYHDWDKNNLPNPEVYDLNLAADIEKTNELFLYGFNFILCHEYSHVDLGHCKSYESSNGFLTVLEKMEFEQQADANAVRLFSEGIYLNNEAATKYGVSIALSSLLFFKSKVSNKIHPDSDLRIMNALNEFQVDDNDTAWLIACAALGLWSTNYSVELAWEEKSTFKSLFESISHQLD